MQTQFLWKWPPKRKNIDFFWEVFLSLNWYNIMIVTSITTMLYIFENLRAFVIQNCIWIFHIIFGLFITANYIFLWIQARCKFFSTLVRGEPKCINYFKSFSGSELVLMLNSGQNHSIIFIYWLGNEFQKEKNSQIVVMPKHCGTCSRSWSPGG